MRTTLDIEDDVLQAVKELARHDGTTAGKVISTLARRGLARNAEGDHTVRYKNGIPLLPRRGEIVTMEHIQRIMDEEGI